MDKLTPLGVNKAKKPGYYGDGGGLCLQVSASGSKSWIFRFTLAGRRREMGLGPAHTVTLPEARAKAKECRLLLLERKDPLEIRNASKLTEALERARMMTFDQCAVAYIAAHRGGWKNPKHANQWKNTLAAYASPIIGGLPVALVDTALVVKVLSPIWQEKTETATRLRGRIESILGWATVSKYRQGENPARWRGHLENLLADPGRSKRTEHHPALPWQEMGAFMAALRGTSGIGARAVEFAILTACRSGEVRWATWAEIDLDAALWVIPAGRMKARREHRVPLSDAALALLRNMPRLGDLVFPGTKPGKPLSDMSLTAVLRRMNRGDITVHGFRSTFRDWCAESVANSFPREVCEHALAHSLPDKVEAAYRRGDLIEKRKLLMQAWADYCGAMPVVASVTLIRGAAPESKGQERGAI
jgi:integrase